MVLEAATGVGTDLRTQLLNERSPGASVLDQNAVRPKPGGLILNSRFQFGVVDRFRQASTRYESSDDAIALRWNQVALAVAHKTGKRIGLDISTRMAMNVVFAPDREHAGDRKPQPFSQADELKGTLALKPFRLQFVSSAPDRGPSIVTELEIQALNASGAIVVVANVELPPRTIGLRILDSEGHKAFSRRRGGSRPTGGPSW